MLSWIAALGAGFVVALVGYAGRGAFAPARLALALARGVAAALLAALWLDAPLGPRAPRPPLLGVDVSASMRRGDGTAWAEARRLADSLGGDVTPFGEDAAAAPLPAEPSGPTSRVAAVVERAAAEGRTAVLITDGELDDADALRRLPRGSAIRVVRPTATPDLAVVSLEVPSTAIVGDSVAVTVALSAGEAGAAASQVVLAVDVGGSPVRLPVPAMAPFAERLVSAAVRLDSAGLRTLVVRHDGLGDTEPRNDTLAVVIDVLARPNALVVSTRPDADARWLDAGVRAALGEAVRTWWRVAPGEWRVAPTLSPISEAEVRRGVAAAGVIVLHGDTAFFGPPGQALRGARWLIAPPASEGEWYVGVPAAGRSPLGDILGGASLDSLPPLAASQAPALGWTALTAQRDKRGPAVPVLTGRDGQPRVAVLTAAGFARWGLRGGEAGGAVPTLAGAVAAWLAESAPDGRAALPTGGVWRAGDRVVWRRTGSDSVVPVRWTREADGASGVDTLRFGRAATQTAPPWPAGRYRIDVPGGTTRLVVNASREVLPRRPVVDSGPVGEAEPAAMYRTTRDWTWLFVVVLLLLVGEWVFRRRIGLR